MGEWLSETWLRVKLLWRRRQLERDLEDEIAFHLAMREQSCRQAGAETAEAAYAARRSFGNATRWRETCRGLWTFAWLEALAADLRYAGRGLRKSPGFSAVAVLSLALGIGANLAIFAVVRSFLFQPLPVAEPERLVVLYNTALRGVWQINAENRPVPNKSGSYSSSFATFAYDRLREASEVAELFAFTSLRRLNVSIEGQPLVASGLMVSGNFFPALGVSTILGRPLDDEDSRPGAAPAVVLSHAFWTRAFGGDPAVLGRKIRVNGWPFTIAGVTPHGFVGLSNGGSFPPMDIALPLSAQPQVAPNWAPPGRSLFTAEDRWWLRVMGRLRPGVVAKQAEGRLSVILHQALAGSSVPALQRAEFADIACLPGARGVSPSGERVERPLFILMAVTGMVLLIACLNVAGLMLARGAARQKEMSIRLALGAGRFHLVRQVLAESILLSSAGGLLGLLIAMIGARGLTVMLAATWGRLDIDLALRWPVLGAAALISVLSGILFGLILAIRLGRGIAPVLKHVPLGAAAPRLTLGRTLIAVQVALSLVLLSGAGMFLRTLWNLGRVQLGFNPRGLVLFAVDPTLNAYDEGRIGGFYQQLLERLEALPGVTSATLVTNPPLAGWSSNRTIAVDGAEPSRIYVNVVGPRFFETLAIPIVAGRGLGFQDHAKAPRVAVMNESAVREFFGNQWPIGRRFRIDNQESETEVVGVVKDSKYDKLREKAPATMFLPHLQSGYPLGGLHIAVRTISEPAGLAGLIRRAVAEVDRDIAVMDLKTHVQQIDETLGQERLFARLLVMFGAFALLLAPIGLYGITSYAVARRTGEIGIRLAVGARPAEVLWMVLRQVVLLAVVGFAAGIPASIAASRLVRSLLFGLEFGDPLALSGAAALMLAVALAAGYLPARRASRMHPLSAIGSE